VQPLVAGWQQALCRTPDGTVVIRDRLDRRPPRNWIEAELGAANLGDARLTARLLEMTGRFYDQPTANIPQACGSAAEAKAAYRFLDNEAVQWNEILKPHFQATPASGPDPRRPRGTNGTSGRSKRRRAAGGSRATVRSVPCRIGVARHGSSSWPTGRATSTTCSSSGRSTGMPPICSSGSKADPIEWLLLSTVPVDSKADAFERLDWYARRWAIEVYPKLRTWEPFFGFLDGPSLVSADATTRGSANGRVVKTLLLSFHFLMSDLRSIRATECFDVPATL
jgi:hypothetical protein